ncbi:MAG: ribosomal L7Ae/L30e/S12e/Gadd45 family protein [Candidatus Nanohaloarchaea archaeon]
MSVEDEIQEAAESDDLVIGTDETLKSSDLEKIVVASNTPRRIREEILEFADDEDVEVEDSDMDNRQLGSACMKPFSAAVVGIKG